MLLFFDHRRLIAEIQVHRALDLGIYFVVLASFIPSTVFSQYEHDISEEATVRPVWNAVRPNLSKPVKASAQEQWKSATP